MEYENILFHPSMLLCGEPDLCGTDFILPRRGNPATIQTFLAPDACMNLFRMHPKIDNLCDSDQRLSACSQRSWLFSLCSFSFQSADTKNSPSQSHQKHMDKLKTIFKICRRTLHNEPLNIEDMANLIHLQQISFHEVF